MQKQWKNFYTAKEKVEWKSTTLMYYTIFHETKIYSHFPPKRGTQNLTSYCIQSEYQYFRGNVNYSFFFSDCNMPWYFKTIEFSPQMSPIENSKRNEVKTNKQKSRGWGGIKHFFSPISLGFFFFFNLLKRNPLICQRRWGRCRRWRRRCLPSPRAPVICTLLWTSLRKLPEPCVAQMCDLIESQLTEKIGKMKKLMRTLSDSSSCIALKKENTTFSETCFTKMATRNCPGMDSVIKPMDTIPEDKKVRVQRTQSTFDPFEKLTNQVKRVHSENNICVNFNKSSSAGRVS